MTPVPCAACPVAGIAGAAPCYGIEHPPACGYVAAGRREWIDHLIAMATGTPVTDPGRIDPHLAMAANLCPTGGPGCGCGSIPRHCGRPDRPLEVFRVRDCLPCVAASAWEAGVEAIG